MVRVFLLLLIFGVGTSCSINNSKSDAFNEVKSAKEKWHSVDPQNYSFQYQTLCFCFFNEEVRVIVREDSVVDVQDLSTNETVMVALGDEQIPIHEYASALFFTINDFFSQLEVQVPVADESSVEFERTTGMPISVSFDYIKEAVDDEITYLFSQLTID